MGVLLQLQPFKANKLIFVSESEMIDKRDSVITQVFNQRLSDDEVQLSIKSHFPAEKGL